MKWLLAFFALSFLFVTKPVCLADADTRTLTLNVPDMNCPLCPVIVRKSLERLEGVKVSAVDLKAKTVTVLVTKATVSEAQLTEATAGAGYPSHVVK